MALLPLSYGSVHLSALTVIFPSQIEKLPWEIACYWLIGVAVAYTLNYFIVWLSNTRLTLDLWFGSDDDCEDDSDMELRVERAHKGLRRIFAVPHACIKGRPRKVLSSLLEDGSAIVWIAVLVIYFGARLYLVAESFYFSVTCSHWSIPDSRPQYHGKHTTSIYHSSWATVIR